MPSSAGRHRHVRSYSDRHIGWYADTTTVTSIPRVARGTAQTDPLLQAAAWGRPLRGRARIRSASGTQSRELLLDCAPLRSGAVAVAVEHSPAWDELTVGLASDVVGEGRSLRHVR